jgi:hypothetical protein
MPEYTPYQKKVIERYYDHRDVIALNRLQEIVSELFLAETDSKRRRLWSQAEKAMTALQVPPGLIQHIMGARKVEVLAHNLRGWLHQANRRPR